MADDRYRRLAEKMRPGFSEEGIGFTIEEGKKRRAKSVSSALILSSMDNLDEWTREQYAKLASLPGAERKTYLEPMRSTAQDSQERSDSIADRIGIPRFRRKRDWDEAEELWRLNREKAALFPELRLELYRSALDREGELAALMEAGLGESDARSFLSILDPSPSGRMGESTPSEEQSHALEDLEKGSTRVIAAVPGAGKTFSLTLAYENAIFNDSIGLSPEEITVISFTTAAENELRKRIASRNPSLAGSHIRVSTAHSLALRIIKEFAPDKLRPLMSDKEISDIVSLSVLPRMAAEGIATSPTRLDALRRNLPRALQIARLNPGDPDQLRLAAKEYRITEAELSAGMRIYDEEKKAQGKCDFEDLIIDACAILENDKGAREKMMGRCKMLIVDEYQDTTRLQRRLEDLIVHPEGIKIIVGDDDQAVFGSLGADPRLMKDDASKSGNQMRSLTVNYRSSKAVLDLANDIALSIPGRIEKACHARSDAGEGSLPMLSSFGTRKQEIEAIMADIRKKIEKGTTDTERRRIAAGIAVLCRFNRQREDMLTAISSDPLLKGLLATSKENPLSALVEGDEARELSIIARALAEPERADAFRDLESLEFSSSNAGWEARYGKGEHARAIDAYKEALGELYIAHGREDRFAEAVSASLRRQLASEAISAYLGIMYPDMALSKGQKAYIDRMRIEDVRRVDAASFLESSALAFKREKTVEDRPGITVCTIHKSKGLEYENVYVPFMSTEEYDARVESADESLREQFSAEEKRIFYTAATRARENLWISFSGHDGRFPNPARVLSQIDRSHVRFIDCGKERTDRGLDDIPSTPPPRHSVRRMAPPAERAQMHPAQKAAISRDAPR